MPVAELISLKPDPIRELLIAEFGRVEVDDTLNWAEGIGYDGDGKRIDPYIATEDLRIKIRREFDRLNRISEDELNAEYVVLVDKVISDQEANSWYNKDVVFANINHWLKMPYWTFEEGILILNNRDPRRVKIERLSGYRFHSPIVGQIFDQLEIARRATQVFELSKQNNKPVKFIEWAVEKGFGVPAELSACLEAEQEKETEHKSTELSGYIPPYIDFMLKAAKALGLSSDKTIVKKQVEHWLRENWPKELGTPTDNIIKYMATLIRRPDEQKGGNPPNKKGT